jgi:hypothetical protein
VLQSDVLCDSGVEAHHVLRNLEPFGPLRVRELSVHDAAEDAHATVALAADIAAHASVTCLELAGAALGHPAALNALIDAALKNRMTRVDFVACDNFSMPHAAPALARLLRGGALTALGVNNYGSGILDARGAALLGEALRANSTLTSLSLESAAVWYDAAAAAALLRGVTAHPSLRILDLTCRQNDVQPEPPAQRIIGAALGELLRANAPALRTLYLCGGNLGDAGLGPLVDALAVNTHLQALDCTHNGVSAVFARERLLPAACLLPAASQRARQREPAHAQHRRLRRRQPRSRARGGGAGCGARRAAFVKHDERPMRNLPSPTVVRGRLRVRWRRAGKYGTTLMHTCTVNVLRSCK